jgi:hypothetical protein
MKNFSIFTLLLSFCLICPGCKKVDDKFTIGNIMKAAFAVVKEKGITELSAESVNEEIENMFSSPEDSIQKKPMIRDRNSDGSNNYNIILDDTIEDERYQASRNKTDPFKK